MDQSNHFVATVKVSVGMITYNQEKYIAQAIDSVLMQKTTYPIELIIGEDNSTDETRKICERYQKEHPEIVKLLPPGPNLGMMKNILRTRQACTGKYIAFLEGDDFWTDAGKIQKQIDFLETNPEFSFCFHKVNILNEDYPDQNRLSNHESTAEIITLDDLIHTGNMVATASAVIRAGLLRNLPDWFNALPFGDYPIYLLLAKHGKIRYFKEVMATYRIHRAGAHGHLTNSKAGLTRAYRQQYEFWKVIRKHQVVDRQKANSAILKAVSRIIENAAQSGQTKALLRYNYLLLVHSKGARWRQAVSNLLLMYRHSRSERQNRRLQKTGEY